MPTAPGLARVLAVRGTAITGGGRSERRAAPFLSQVGQARSGKLSDGGGDLAGRFDFDVDGGQRSCTKSAED